MIILTKARDPTKIIEVEVGTIFEVGISFGVILHFVLCTNLEVGINLEVCTHYKATRTGGASGGHFRQNF